MILRVALSCGALGFIFYFLVVARKRPAQKLGMALTFLTILIFALYPEASTFVAQQVGVGRGVDLVLYLSSFVLLILTFTLYLNQRDLKEQVTQLTRHSALSHASFDKHNHGEQEDHAQSYVVIPVYQEAEVIADVLQEVLSAGYHIIAIDDGSTDGSLNVLRSMSKHCPNLIVLAHPVNLGQGAALQTGFDFALARGAHSVATFDADGQHRVEDLSLVLNTLDSNPHIEVVLGSRFLGSVEGMPRRRKYLLKGKQDARARSRHSR